jgi:tetratricopeptide (TPR) repeat protein
VLTATGDWHHQAIAASQAGRHDEAASLFRRAAEASPGERTILTNLGLALARGGRYAEAIEAYRSALELAPGHAGTLAKLGRALSSAGHHDQAIEALTEAVSRNGSDPDSLNALGAALAVAGRREEARRALESTVRLDPDFGEAWANLGQLEAETGDRWRQAGAAFERAAALEPSGPLFYKLGVARGRLGELAAACAAYRRSLELDPRCPETWNNLGHVLGGLEDHTGALEALERALALRPDYTEARYNLGVTLQSLNRHQEARRAYQMVLAQRGPHADSLNNLAGICLTEARPDLAAGLYGRALEANPAHGDARWNLALAQLASGDFENGWRNYEARKATRRYDAPRLDRLEAARGRTVLLWCEQGLGDAIQFLRYAAVLSAAGAARIVVECPAPLMSLFSGAAGIDQVVPRGAALPAFDLHTPLLSMPLVAGTTLDTVPPPGPAYNLPAGRRAHWRAQLDALEGLRVGIVWGGSVENRKGLSRSMPLEAMAVLAREPGVTLISLQHGPQTAGLETPAGRGILAWPQADVGDTAALAAELDLVITVDTMMAHLAGMLAPKTWLLLPYAADWRWMTGRGDSPWYPNMRLLRQTRPGDWAGPVEQAAEAMRALRA